MSRVLRQCLAQRRHLPFLHSQAHPLAGVLRAQVPGQSPFDKSVESASHRFNWYLDQSPSRETLGRQTINVIQRPHERSVVASFMTRVAFHYIKDGLPRPSRQLECPWP